MGQRIQLCAGAPRTAPVTGATDSCTEGQIRSPLGSERGDEVRWVERLAGSSPDVLVPGQAGARAEYTLDEPTPGFPPPDQTADILTQVVLQLRRDKKP